MLVKLVVVAVWIWLPLLPLSVQLRIVFWVFAQEMKPVIRELQRMTYLLDEHATRLSSLADI